MPRKNSFASSTTSTPPGQGYPSTDGSMSPLAGGAGRSSVRSDRPARIARLVLPGVVRALGRRPRLSEGVDALAVEQGQQPDQEVGGEQGVAQRAVPTHDLDAEPASDRFHGVLLVVGVHGGGQQQRVEYRLGERDAGGRLLEPQERQVEG